MSQRLLRVLLRFYPEPFRRRFGRELLQIWQLEGARARQQGRFTALRHWLGFVPTTLLEAVGQRLRRDPSLPIPPPDRKEPFVSALLQDFRFALRTLGKRPGWTLAVVATLAIGLGATTAVFSIFNDVLLRPLPYPEAEDLVTIQPTGTQSGRWIAASYPALELYREAQEGLESIEAWSTLRSTVDLGQGPTRRRTSWVTAGLIDTLGVGPALGRALGEADDALGSPPVVLIGHQLWQSEFGGDEAVIGKSIEIDETSHEIVGVLPAEFAFPHRDIELWMPMSLAPRMHDTFYLLLLGRLAEGVGIDRLSARFASTPIDIPGGYDTETVEVRLEPVLLHEDMVGDLGPQLGVFLAAVVAVLLIACLNVAHLILGRAIGRRRELAVRAALGAGRRQLVRQLVVESTVLGLIGGGLGTLLAAAILEGLRRLGPDWMPRPQDLGLDATALGFGLVLALGVGSLLGLLPAIRALGQDPSLGSIGARGEVGGRGQRLRASLIVAQIAGAVVLLGAALLLIHSFQTLADSEGGFESVGAMMLDIDLPPGRYPEQAQQHAYYHRLMDELRSLPGVESAAFSSSHPFTFYLGYPLIPDGYVPADGERLITRVRLVSNDYFPTAGAELLEGRYLQEKDAMQAMVINASLAEQFFPEGAVGRRIRLGENEEEPWRTIVGVVADVEYYGRPDTWTTTVYLPITGVDYAFEMTPLIRTSGEPLALAEAIRERVAAVDPRVPVGNMTRLEDFLWTSKAVPRLRTTLLGAFGAVALLLSAIGLYGVMAFWVADRRREMGVRLALGADRARIVRRVLGQGMLLVTIGIGIGLLLSWPAFRLLHSRIPDLVPWQPELQSAAIALLALAALAACWLPARRAAGVDPMAVLREE